MKKTTDHTDHGLRTTDYEKVRIAGWREWDKIGFKKKSLGILSGLFSVGCVAAFGSDADFVTVRAYGGGGVAIIGYHGSMTNKVMDIPSTIFGQPVAAVQVCEFAGMSNLTAIVFPASVGELMTYSSDFQMVSSNAMTWYFAGVVAPMLDRPAEGRTGPRLGAWRGFLSPNTSVCFLPGSSGFDEFICPNCGDGIPVDQISHPVIQWDARAAIQQTPTGACVTVTGRLRICLHQPLESELGSHHRRPQSREWPGKFHRHQPAADAVL